MYDLANQLDKEKADKEKLIKELYKTKLSIKVSELCK